MEETVKEYRYLDVNDNEIQPENIDYSKYHADFEKLFIKHHDAIEEAQEECHYEVKKFYFDDGTEMEVNGNSDEHVKVIDADEGIFEYVDCGEGKVYFGADIDRIVDKEKVEAKEAYDEYEDIYRVTAYTEEELSAQAESLVQQEKYNDFIENGPDKLDETSASVEDITVMLAEMIGASE